MSVNKFGQHSHNNYKPQYLIGRSGYGYLLNRHNDLDMEHKRLSKIGKDIIDSSDMISLHYLNMNLENFVNLKETFQSVAEQYYEVMRNEFLVKLELYMQDNNKVIESELNNTINNKTIIETLLKLWKEDRTTNKMLDLEMRVTELCNGLIEYQGKVEILKETVDNKFANIAESVESREKRMKDE
jgi:hypothetical protein